MTYPEPAARAKHLHVVFDLLLSYPCLHEVSPVLLCHPLRWLYPMHFEHLRVPAHPRAIRSLYTICLAVALPASTASYSAILSFNWSFSSPPNLSADFSCVSKLFATRFMNLKPDLYWSPSHYRSGNASILKPCINVLFMSVI